MPLFEGSGAPFVDEAEPQKEQTVAEQTESVVQKILSSYKGQELI